MGNYGIKVMKVGKDITSDTPEDHILSSKYSTVKIVQEAAGTATVAGSSTQSVTISHNLGFVPMFMIYTEATPSSGNWRFGLYYAPSEDIRILPNTVELTSYSDTSNVYIVFANNNASSRTFRYYYYLLGDSAI